MKRRAYRRLLRATLLCCLWSVLGGCSMMGRYSPLRPLEQRIVFQPGRYPQGNWQPMRLDPEDARFEAADGTKLHGWFAEHPAPQAVVLFYYGNAGNVSFCAEMLNILNQRHQLSVMSFDYRGYGKSESQPTGAGILQDARAARAWLARYERVSRRV
jgi:hypothetical protein